MINLVGDLVRNLVLLLFVVVLLEMLMPQGQFNRYLRMVAGLLVILMMVTFIGSLLRGFPAENSLAALAERSGVSPVVKGSDLWQLNRRQALHIYRDNLAEAVRRIVEEEGGRQVSSIQLAIDENESSAAYGSVLSLTVTVAMAEPVPGEQAAADPKITPVRVSPIRIGPLREGSGGEPGPAGSTGRLPVLERVLADRLQLPLPVIMVRENR